MTRQAFTCAQGKEGVDSFGTRPKNRFSRSSEEDFSLRRRRLEDFLAEEQERLQNFLLEESSVLAARRQSGRVGGIEEEGGGEVVDDTGSLEGIYAFKY